MIAKWKTWLDESDRSLTHFGDLLGKLKNQSRFLNNYPNATTKLFELMYAIKKQEDSDLNKVDAHDSKKNGGTR